MYYAGIDYHKKYSVVCILNDDGERVWECRIYHTQKEQFGALFASLDGPVKVVFESGFNWSWLYELLEKVPGIESITLANPHKVRLIAEAQIKTDKLDAQKLAMLLRLDVVPRCHVPSREMRDRKELLRQRAFWTKQRTRIKNRIHKIVNKQHELKMPQVSDMFGKKGREALDKAVLPDLDAMLLRQNLEMLDSLSAVIKRSDKQIKEDGRKDEAIGILESIPGVGLITGSIIATETDGIDRFINANRYVAYAGLAPTTHSSGGKTYNGRMMNQCNKWLRWGYIEASWVAIRSSSYFGSLYRAQRQRGKKANTAIAIVARRMCRLSYQLLKENRTYEERFVPRRLLCGSDGIVR